LTAHRLPEPTGTLIDRSRAVSFRFNGRQHCGFAGDTLASALLANGVTLVGRSFKFHRPRGIYSCGIEEPAALVDVGRGALRTPNVRATTIDIYDGLVADSVNCWPGVGLDLGSIAGCFSGMLPAGFYYKTFKWPSWHLFEPSIRRMAGLGRASLQPDPDRYEEVALNTDVLVVGGGIAGLAAAVSAAKEGAQAVLLSSARELGGALRYPADRELSALISQAGSAGVRILKRTTAFGAYDHNLVCARQLCRPGEPAPRAAQGALRERLWKIRARKVVSALGAFERPMLFPDNDRPGVMLAGAAAKYAGAYGVACGRRAVVAANCDRAYETAATLRELGVEIVAIIDCRPGSLVRADRTSCRGIHLVYDAAIVSVSGTHAVRGCSVAPIHSSRAVQRFDCDLILSSGGFAPAVHLHSQAGGKLRWVDESAMFVPDGPAPGMVSVGACAGIFSREEALSHAHEVGAALARGTPVPIAPVGGAGLALADTHRPRRRSRQFVDLQNDVTTDDIALAARENYRSVEHMKRYTTVGMGTDQGKTSNINALVVMGGETGRGAAAVGTTRFRPPFAPITMGAFAGRRVGVLYRPRKCLPAQAWHEARGAAFEEYGGWWRPSAYPTPGETVQAAALREAASTRRDAGIFDASPLGKLEIFGRDAAAFLDRMYVGVLSTLAIGQARYGLLLNENGILVDDGIVARLGEQRFWVNTTSGGAERTAAAFEEWLQCEYGDMQVAVTPVTSRWANITVAGPRAWDWLAAARLDPALAPDRMKHMTIAAAELAGVPLRVLRASFSGELGYELNVPADHALELFDRLWAHAPRFNACAYGVEALQTMRIEKGYIHIGTDTDGTTLPQDVGFGRSMAHKSENFVGRRSLSRPAARDPNRLQLVGLMARDGQTLLPVGSQIAQAPPPTRSQGHVTSSAMSPVLGRPVALAMLARGSTRIGERVRVHHLGRTIEADVVTPPFVDPSGDRLRG
jgi:sarcosine oxidase subunit alpha